MDPSENYLLKYERFLSWSSFSLKGDGILVGADLSQEWLLPWWWKHYQKYNSYPVAFIDFGMSFASKNWCKERGELIPIRIFSDFIAEKEEIDPALICFLEEEFGKSFWECRNTWFKKPLAFLQTPFQRSIWIDLDCEIKGPIGNLFEYADTQIGFSMAEDVCDSLLSYSYPIYNSGVVPFRAGIEIIQEWAKTCLEQNAKFRGDQEIFSFMIDQKQIPIQPFSPLYNWSRTQKENDQILILHWHGVYGKYVIRNQINVEELCF